MGITSGYCTVGNFGSNQRMDYTVLGKPVNLAARLQSLAQADQILIAGATHALVEQQVDCSFVDEVQPKGFSRPVRFHSVDGLKEGHQHQSASLSRTLDHIEVNILDSSDIPAAMRELKQIQEEIEEQMRNARQKDGGEA